MKTWTQVVFALLLIVVVLPSITIATEVFTKNQNLENQYQNIESLFNIATIVEDKVYIPPDNIFILSNQIYVKIADEFISIPHLSCDMSGIFISMEEIQTGRHRTGFFPKTWECRKCGYDNYEGIDFCGQCGFGRYEKL